MSLSKVYFEKTFTSFKAILYNFMKTGSFASCNIQDGDLMHILKILERNHHLIVLNFSNNYLRHSIFYLKRFISLNKSLREIYLRANLIGPNGAIAVANCLCGNNTIQVLDISFNRIGHEGAIAISKALISNSSLLSLNISSNNIQDEGAMTIARLISKNSTLTELSIRDNSIRDEGSLFLGLALAENTSLKIFNFGSRYSHKGNNIIGDRAIHYFSSGISTNEGLRILDLSFCSINFEQIQILSIGLSMNRFLYKIYLFGNEFQPEGILSLVKVAKSNRLLYKITFGMASFYHRDTNTDIFSRYSASLSHALKQNKILYDRWIRRRHLILFRKWISSVNLSLYIISKDQELFFMIFSNYDIVRHICMFL
jgi:hypothetical protein